MKRIILISVLLLTFMGINAQGVGVASDAYRHKPNLSIVRKHTYYALCDEKDSVYFDNLDTVIVKDSDIKSYLIKRNNKWGFFSEMDGMCIPIEFDEIEEKFRHYYLVTKNNKKGIYQCKKIIVPCKQDSIVLSYQYGVDFLFKKDNLWGAYNMKGEITIPNIYEQLVNSRVVIALKKNDKNYYIISNKAVQLDSLDIPVLFTRRTDWPKQNSYYKVMKGGKWGIINEDLSNVIPNEFQNIIYNQSFDVFLLKQNNKWGMSDFSGKILEPIVHDDMYYFSDFNNFIVKDNGVMNFYDAASLKKLDELSFDKIVYTRFEYYKISLNGKRTLIKKDLKMIFPLKYDDLFPLENNLFQYEVNKKVGVVDSNDKIIIPAVYENLYIKKNMAFVTQDSKRGVVGLNNEILLPIKFKWIDPKDDYIEVTNDEFKSFKLDYKFKCIENCAEFKK